MSVTPTEIDAFVQFARAEADNGHAPASLEECLSRWRASSGPDATRPYQIKPFPDGKSLLDVLREDGLVGLDDDGPDDLASNPKYMEGFGEGRG